jgi:hypothetical protein
VVVVEVGCRVLVGVFKDPLYSRPRDGVGPIALGGTLVPELALEPPPPPFVSLRLRFTCPTHRDSWSQSLSLSLWFYLLTRPLLHDRYILP